MIIDEILFKEFSNETLSAAEKDELNGWLKEDKYNRLVYAQMRLSFSQVEAYKKDEIKSAIWKDLEVVEGQRELDIRPTRKWMVLKIAAVFAIFCSVAVFVGINISNQDTTSEGIVAENQVIETVSLPGQKITTRLDDGSQVKLNADSRLISPELFDENQRKVRLTGEAFFDVARDEKRPFIIETNFLEVTVLGTSFNVRTYEDEDRKGVQVKSGRVSVKNKKGDNVMLSANEMVLIDENGSLIKKSFSDFDREFGWTDRKLVFSDHSLSQVVKSSERWFGVEITFENEETMNTTKRYTANYENPGIKEVLESLSHVYEFEFEIEGKEVTIK